MKNKIISDFKIAMADYLNNPPKKTAYSITLSESLWKLYRNSEIKEYGKKCMAKWSNNHIKAALKYNNGYLGKSYGCKCYVLKY